MRCQTPSPNPARRDPEQHQGPNTKHNPGATIGDWNLELGIFLGFGIWDLGFLWSLVLGGWSFLLLAIGLTVCTPQLSAQPLPAIIAISPQPLHAGRISPMLFGSFIELLDDLVPGLWSEMLNDRSFEGVTKLANWV